MKKLHRDQNKNNVMWVPLFAGVMTVALSNEGSVNPYIIAVFMGVVDAAMCYLDYRVFMKRKASANGDMDF